MAILCKIAHPSGLEEKVEASLEGVQVAKGDQQMEIHKLVTDEMSRAASKVAGLAFNGAQAERKAS
jgi:hypothetical protein